MKLKSLLPYLAIILFDYHNRGNKLAGFLYSISVKLKLYQYL